MNDVKDDQERKSIGAEPAASPLIAKQMGELLVANGYKTYRHVSLLTEILGISGQAARRRVQGLTPFTEAELKAVLSRIGYDYNGLYGLVKQGDRDDASPTSEQEGRVEVEVEFNGRTVKALAKLRTAGPWMRAADSTFAVKLPDESYELRRTAQLGDDEQPCAIASLEIQEPYAYEGTGPRVVVVDEQNATALATTAALRNMGFNAVAVSSPESLDAELQGGTPEAFYVSWGAGSRWSPDEVAAAIREVNGACPIVLSGPFGQKAAAATLAEVSMKHDATLLPQITSTSLVAMTLLRELRARRSSIETSRAAKAADR